MASNSNVYPTIDQVEFAKIQYTDPKNSLQGTGIPMCYATIAGNDIHFQSSAIEEVLLKPEDPKTEKERLAALAECMTVSSVFHLQKPEDRKYPVQNGQHTVFFEPSPKQLAIFEAIDEFNRQKILENAKVWFKTAKMPPEFLAQAYKGLVEVDEHSGKKIVRVKVNEVNTKIFVQRDEARSHFVPVKLNYLTKGKKVVMALRYASMWFQQQSSGASLYASKVMIMHSNDLGQSGKFNTGSVELVIEDNFEPPVDASTTEPAKPVIGDGASFASGATEATVLNVPVTPSTMATVGNVRSYDAPTTGPMF